MMSQVEKCFGYLPEIRFENLELVIFLPKVLIECEDTQTSVFKLNFMQVRGRLALAQKVEVRYK